MQQNEARDPCSRHGAKGRNAGAGGYKHCLPGGRFEGEIAVRAGERQGRSDERLGETGRKQTHFHFADAKPDNVFGGRRGDGVISFRSRVPQAHPLTGDIRKANRFSQRKLEGVGREEAAGDEPRGESTAVVRIRRFRHHRFHNTSSMAWMRLRYRAKTKK